MQLNISLHWLLFIVGIVVTAFLLVMFSGVMNGSVVDQSVLGSLQTDDSLTAPVSVAYAETIAFRSRLVSREPVRIQIPKIKVDAAIIQVGLTASGAMDVPKGPEHAAWFSPGVRPGESGSAVISGHYGWKNNIPAVFDNLHQLKKGDEVYVEDEAGEVLTFIVREVRRYGEFEDASEVFSSSDEKVRLNLITCEGTWDKERKSYSHRLVVFTDKE